MDVHLEVPPAVVVSELLLKEILVQIILGQPRDGMGIQHFQGFDPLFPPFSWRVESHPHGVHPEGVDAHPSDDAPFQVEIDLPDVPLVVGLIRKDHGDFFGGQLPEKILKKLCPPVFRPFPPGGTDPLRPGQKDEAEHKHCRDTPQIVSSFSH